MLNNSYESFSTMQYIQNLLAQIFLPYIIIVSFIGIVGNVLTIILLSKRSLTKNFNNCTLIALAVTDLLFNLTLVSHCITALSSFNFENFCRILSFISHLAELLSACFTAHFTIQRFIAVRFPLSVVVEKNIHLLHYLIVPLVILFGISYCSALIKENRYESCEEELYLNWFISDALLSFVIPFTIIVTLNLLIIFHLRKTSRESQRLTFSFKRTTKKETIPLNPKHKQSITYELNSHSRSSEHLTVSNVKTSVYQLPPNGEPNDNLLSVGTRHRRVSSIRSTTRSHVQSHRVTRMLILVSTCFLLLNAPSHICTISLKIYTLQKSQLSNHADSNETLHENSSWNSTTTTTITTSPPYRDNPAKLNINFFHIVYIITITSQHLSYLSYSINFFLYSFCGMKFRRELMKFLSRRGRYRESTPTSPIPSGSHAS